MQIIGDRVVLLTWDGHGDEAGNTSNQQRWPASPCISSRQRSFVGTSVFDEDAPGLVVAAGEVVSRDQGALNGGRPDRATWRGARAGAGQTGNAATYDGVDERAVSAPEPAARHAEQRGEVADALTLIQTCALYD